MKILMLSPSFHPNVGGVEKHVKRVAEEMTKLGDVVTIITLKPREADQSEETVNGVRILRMESGRRTRIWKWIWNHRRLFLDTDVIHCHDYVTFHYWYSPFRLLFFWKPTFITFHGFEKHPPDAAAIRRRKICEAISSGHICVGKYIRKWYRTDCEVILWGAVDSPVNIVPQEQKEDAIVFVGRLEPDTGILEYFKGLSLFGKRTGSSVLIYVCGSGSLLEKLKNSECTTYHTVEFEGRVENPFPYFQRCRYAFVSGYLTIFEAMISGALAFSIFDNPLKEDYLRMIPDWKNIMMVCSSPEDLADKFLKVKGNQELQENLISRAHRFAKKMSWGSVAREYLDLYARKVDVD